MLQECKAHLSLIPDALAAKIDSTRDNPGILGALGYLLLYYKSESLMLKYYITIDKKWLKLSL